MPGAVAEEAPHGKVPAPQVYRHLPDCAGRDALRAGMLALQCVPTHLPLDVKECHTVLSRLAGKERVFVFVDISAGAGSSSSVRSGGLDEVLGSVPVPLRARTVLQHLFGIEF